MKIHILQLLLLLLAIFLSACTQEANDAGSGSKKDTTVASIKISPSGLMLTNMNESHSLTATAYNAAGETLDITDFSWETSKPDSVSVDASGTATSQTSLGSATITAHAAGVTSTPLLISIAQPVPEAVLINDTQVIGDIRPHDNSEPLSLGSLYDVTLTGITPPEVGEILISTGEATVGGRVAGVREENGQTIVTLEFVGLNELFTAFEINEEMPLSLANMVVNDDVATLYDLTTNPDGSITFTPKTNTTVSGIVGQPVGTQTILQQGPFKCKTSLQTMPVDLTVLPSITVNTTLNYALIWENTQKIAMVSGGIVVDAKTIWSMTVALDGKVNCDAEMGKIPIPIGGVVSMFFGGWVPFGAGVELAGRIDLTGLGFEAKAHADAILTLGLDCSANVAGCELLHNYTSNSSLETTWTTPSTITDHLSSLRLNPSLSGYGFANLDIGLRRSQNIKLQVLAARAGLNMAGTLAVLDGQIDDLNFASDYKLSLDASISPGENINSFLARLGLNFLGDPALFTMPLSTSPKAASISADVASFITNDLVNFTVRLDPTSIDYLSIYNIAEVQIYKREMDLFHDIVGTLIGTVTATGDQTEFTIPWTADYDGDINNDEFYAYVVTKFLPFPYFESLELGVVTPTTKEKITFVGGEYGNQMIYIMDTTGIELTALLENIMMLDYLTVSPDGTKIAFIRRESVFTTVENSVAGIYIIDTTNGTLNRLTASNFDMLPSWSPDGKKIVFSRNRDDGISDIYSINADGSNLLKLVVGSPFSTLISTPPVWSPDGTKIAFESKRDNNYSEIYVMNADGSNQTRLTFVDPYSSGNYSSAGNYLVSWSPDGTKMAFVSTRDGNHEIYVMNADGSNQKRLTNNTARDIFSHKQLGKVWSPDGTKIMFLSTRDGDYWQTYIMNADGSNQTKLATTPFHQFCPAWSPDGTKIVFDDSSTGIYVVNADGSSLTHISGQLGCPYWIQ